MMSDQKSKIISRGECTTCGSSDANVLYEDNSKYCFSCETYTKGDGMQQQQPTYESPIRGVHQNHFTQGNFTSLSDRRISENTCRFYGVTTKNDRHIYPYHDASGSLIANKIRQTSNKSFFVEGNLPQATLFGQNKFASRGKFVTVCEGEIDAMSAYEMLGSKWAVLSIKNGAQSAVKDVKANYEYLSGFEKVVLCFDNDEHGRKAANQVAQILNQTNV